jgi:hypothetical protein
MYIRKDKDGMAMKAGKRSGRPPVSGETRSKMLPIRITEKEFRLLMMLAKQQGCSIADVLMKAFRKE